MLKTVLSKFLTFTKNHIIGRTNVFNFSNFPNFKKNDLENKS